jgi:tetratricopeptide (TPR) repeat protein
VEHWLADEPVSACAEPLLFRARRWARKHPRSVAGLAATVLVGVLGLSAGLYFVNAERNRTELARQDADNQRIEAEKNAQEALDRETETKAVLDFVENKIFAAARPKNQAGGMGYDVKLADALKASLPFVGKSFPDKPLIEARLRMTLGTSFRYLGKGEIAAEQDEMARILYTKHRGPDHADTIGSMSNLAISYAALGRHADALKLCEETLALQKDKLGPDHPDTLGSMSNLANSYEALGRIADALKLREETLALRKGKLGPDHPDTLGSMSNLAISYTALGRHADALKLRKETLALQKDKLGPDHPDTLGSMNNLAASYYKLGRHVDALKLCEETLALQKAKLGPDHPDTLMSMGNLAETLFKLDRGGEAITIIDECLKRATGKVVDPQTLPQVVDLRLRHFQKAKDAAGCRATAEIWEKLKRMDADSLYNAACYRAVTAVVIKQDAKTPGADAARLAKEEADRAMAWLAQAVTAGYKNAGHMKKDTDLDALRDRPDFQKLLSEVEAKGKDKESKPAQPQK